MSDIATAIYKHLRTMAPHQLERLTAIQLREAADEIARLRAELSGARQHGETGQPALSDAERDDMACAASRLESDPNGPRDLQVAATLRGVMDRHGGCPDREQPARNDEATPARSGDNGGDSPDRGYPAAAVSRPPETRKSLRASGLNG